MFTFDVSHRCRLSCGDSSECSQVRLDVAKDQPLRIGARSYLEQMLIQSRSPTSPRRSSREPDQENTMSPSSTTNSGAMEALARSTPFGAPSTELSDFQHRQPFLIVLGSKPLEGKSISEVGDLIKR